MIACDAKRFDQILFNLLSNAVKYTPCGGKIAFEASETGIDAVPAELQEGLKPSARYVRRGSAASSSACSSTRRGRCCRALA